MEIREGSLQGFPLLTVVGEIDHSTAEEFDEAVERGFTADTGLFLDMAGCPYLDSGGLAVLLSLVRQARPKGWVGVIGASLNLVRLLEIVGLTNDPYFHLFGDSDEASAFAAGTV